LIFYLNQILYYSYCLLRVFVGLQPSVYYTIATSLQMSQSKKLLHLIAETEAIGSFRTLKGRLSFAQLVSALTLKDQTNNFTPLHSAAKTGRRVVLRHMLASIPKGSLYFVLSVRSDSGQTALHVAAVHGHLQMADCDGNTALHLAASHGIKTFTKLTRHFLVANERDIIEIRNNRNETAGELILKHCPLPAVTEHVQTKGELFVEYVLIVLL